MDYVTGLALVDDLEHGYLPFITRLCGPANNVTDGSGDGQRVLPPSPGYSSRPYKIDAPFCGNSHLDVSWASTRADGVDAPIMDLCNAKPGAAYTAEGVCFKWSKRELVLAATLGTAHRELISSTGLMGVKPGIKASTVEDKALQDNLAAAGECIGGWMNGLVFMCQHCPGCCNGDLPGDYSWPTTPSSYDGRTVWEEMLDVTPREYMEGTGLLP